MIYFNLPDLGEGLQEAELNSWSISVGDHIKQDQVIVSVETAKAIVDLPSPQDGTIKQIFGQPGDLIHVGDPLVEFMQEHDSTKDTGTVVGEVITGQTVVTEPSFSIHHTSNAGFKATPAVRALAASLHVNLALVKPSGKNDTISATDIHRIAKLINTAGEMIPLKSVRRTMSLTMSQAHNEVVPVTLCDDADIQTWQTGEDITLRLIRAIAHACHAEPSLNVWYDSHALTRIKHSHVDLGIAIDTEHGLFIPVLKNIANRPADDLRDGLNALKAAVNSRSIPPEQMRGHTITLSNFGVFAGRYANPVVIPPTVAIIGAGKTRLELVLNEKQIEEHLKLPISITFDHRVVTGGETARFLAVLLNDLHNPD